MKKYYLLLFLCLGIMWSGLAQSDTSSVSGADTSKANVVQSIMKLKDSKEQKDLKEKIKKFLVELTDVNTLMNSIKISRAVKADTIKKLVKISHEIDSVDLTIGTHLNMDHLYANLFTGKKKYTYDGKVQKDMPYGIYAIDLYFTFDTLGSKKVFKIHPTVNTSESFDGLLAKHGVQNFNAILKDRFSVLFEHHFDDLGEAKSKIEEAVAFTYSMVENVTAPFRDQIAARTRELYETLSPDDIQNIADLLDKQIDLFIHQEDAQYIFEYSNLDTSLLHNIEDYQSQLYVINQQINTPTFIVYFPTKYAFMPGEVADFTEKVLYASKNKRELDTLHFSMFPVFINQLSPDSTQTLAEMSDRFYWNNAMFLASAAVPIVTGVASFIKNSTASLGLQTEVIESQEKQLTQLQHILCERLIQLDHDEANNLLTSNCTGDWLTSYANEIHQLQELVSPVLDTIRMDMVAIMDSTEKPYTEQLKAMQLAAIDIKGITIEKNNSSSTEELPSFHMATPVSEEENISITQEDLAIIEFIQLHEYRWKVYHIYEKASYYRNTPDALSKLTVDLYQRLQEEFPAYHEFNRSTQLHFLSRLIIDTL